MRMKAFLFKGWGTFGLLSIPDGAGGGSTLLLLLPCLFLVGCSPHLQQVGLCVDALDIQLGSQLTSTSKTLCSMACFIDTMVAVVAAATLSTCRALEPPEGWPRHACYIHTMLAAAVTL